MITQFRALIAGLCVLVVLIIAGLIYWRGSSNATTKADLRSAREVITTERETLKVTTATNTRVDAETVATAKTAEAADHEISTIRLSNARLRNVEPRDAALGTDAAPGPRVGSVDAADPNPDVARVLQLAREARAAAVVSSARLQSTGAGAR